MIDTDEMMKRITELEEKLKKAEAHKTFFDPNKGYNWGDDSTACARDIKNALKSVFLKYTEQGFSPREIAHIAAIEIWGLEIQMILSIRRGGKLSII